MTKLVLFALLALPAYGQLPATYKWSATALTAGTTLDCVSSYGAYEANPLWRSANGRFETKGVALRFAFVGSTLLVQRFVLRRHPSTAKLLTVVNFTSGVTLGGIAFRNFRVR